MGESSPLLKNIYFIYNQYVGGGENDTLGDVLNSQRRVIGLYLLTHTLIHLAAGTGLGPEGSSGNRPRLHKAHGARDTL